MFDPLSDEEWRLARLDRLGLKEDPFKLSADPRYLYLGPEHLAVYRQAQAVISRRRGLALITGDMGMGKSSLARRLYDVYASESRAWRSATSTPLPSTRPWMPPARSRMPWAFRRSAVSSARWKAWKQMMANAYTTGRNVIVILDDAQLMDSEALEVHPPPVQL